MVSILPLLFFFLYQKLRVMVVSLLLDQVCVQKVSIVLLVLLYFYLRVLGFFEDFYCFLFRLFGECLDVNRAAATV